MENYLIEAQIESFNSELRVLRKTYEELDKKGRLSENGRIQLLDEMIQYEAMRQALIKILNESNE